MLIRNPEDFIEEDAKSQAIIIIRDVQSAMKYQQTSLKVDDREGNF